MSQIQWTGRTSNIFHLVKEDGSHGGHFCRKISEGCLHCYSESMNSSKYFKFASGLKFAGKMPSNMALDEKELKSWLSPKVETVFVNSMTDTFLEEIPDEWLDKIFDAMLRSPHKTFQILTKRADRMAEYVANLTKKARSRVIADSNITNHIWLGVTVENQKAVSDRAFPLHKLHNAGWTTFYSVEPLLENVELYLNHEKVDWCIVGGESGTGARKCKIEWIRCIIQQCQSADVPVFAKQLGTNCFGDNGHKLKWRDRKGGNPEEWPETMPREFPARGKANAS